MGALETFHKYMGTGLILIWYLAALIWLFLKEKRRPVRVLFLYLPALTLFLFFNPLFYRLYDRYLHADTYFRILWLLPVTATLAYFVVAVCILLEGKKKRMFAVLSALIVLFTGTNVYSNPLFSWAENVYHVPDEVVEICDLIHVEGREVMAAFPEEFLLYVRQYAADVCMPYGRESIQGAYDELYMLMLGREIPVDRMAALAKERLCHYVILPAEKKLIGSMEAYDYELYGVVGDYLIYRDTTMDFRNTMEE